MRPSRNSVLSSPLGRRFTPVSICINSGSTPRSPFSQPPGDVEARQCEFWLGTLLPIGINVLERCHAEGTSRHSARTEAVYDK
ncbi:hypothetical protein TNCV_3486981 [Trichonephila clavipes]|nr:hypothetical protein TNCV_3486981 [Trichonephila clavipes]